MSALELRLNGQYRLAAPLAKRRGYARLASGSGSTTLARRRRGLREARRADAELRVIPKDNRRGGQLFRGASRSRHVGPKGQVVT